MGQPGAREIRDVPLVMDFARDEASRQMFALAFGTQRMGRPAAAPPGIEYARMAELIPALVHLDPPFIMPIDLERFSPYFKHPAEFGIEIIGPCPEFPLLYPVSQETLHDLAYDFTFRHLDGRDPDVYAADVREAVRKWQESAASAVGSLIHRRGPGFVLVQDRRPGLESADYLFEGVEAAHGHFYLSMPHHRPQRAGMVRR
jgi:hypothetical protein